MLRLVSLVGVLLLVGGSAATSLDISEQLQQKSLFEVVRAVARKHPVEVEYILDGLIMHIPDPQTRYDQWEAVKRAVFDESPYAMDGVCTVCRVVVGLIRIILEDNEWDDIASTVHDYCVLLFEVIDPQIDSQICYTVDIQGPHVAAIIKASISTPGQSAEDVCRYLNACFEIPSEDDVLMGPHSFPLPIYSLHELEEAVRPHRFRGKRGLHKRQSKEDALKIVQLTDIHIEKDYAEGAPENCGLYVCCQEGQQGVGSAGYHGSYQCNVPESTIRLFLQRAVELQPDMLIFSGDIPPHTVWDETEESQLECTEILTRVMKEILVNITAYPTIGNHEMFPTNLLSTRYNNHTLPMLASFANLWQDLASFTEEQMTTMRSAGYYTMLVPFANNLRILSINNVYMYTGNFYNVLNHRPIAGIPPQLGEATILKNNVRTILQNAANNNEKVIIITHHVAGGSSFIVSESIWWEELLVEFANTVVLQVAGHTHTDEFRLIKDADNIVRSMKYVNPSIDMHGTVNPSMRVYYLDKETYEILDYDQYYFHLPTYPDNTTTPHIQLLYSAKAEYGLEDLSPRSWENLLKRFETDPTLLLKHRDHSKVNSRPPATSCDESCRRSHVCRQLHARYDHYQVCASGPAPATPTTYSRTWPALTTNAGRARDV